MEDSSPKAIDVGMSSPLIVPLLHRSWPLWDGAKPKRTNGKPVIRPVVHVGSGPTFAELAVAAELGDEGALWWCWIDTFNQRAYRRGMFDVPPLTPSSDVLSVLATIWVENGGTLRGAWDAFAIYPDGRVTFREVKRRGKDRLNNHQRRFAEAARRAIPNVDLAVVEWTTAAI